MLTVFKDDQGTRILKISRGGIGWAEIHIGQKGQFMALSDYGNYGYLWTHVGGDSQTPYLKRFCEFLVGVEESPHYFIGKLSTRKVYDSKSTVEGIKQAILERRFDRSFSKERARDEWALIDEYGLSDGDGQFENWLEETQLDEAWEYHSRMPEPDVVAFVERVMIEWMAPILKEYLARI